MKVDPIKPTLNAPEIKLLKPECDDLRLHFAFKCKLRRYIKGIPITFLMTDGQIVNERFLVYINDLLSSGFIPDLMTAEEKETMCNAVRNEVKQAGIIDTAAGAYTRSHFCST